MHWLTKLGSYTVLLEVDSEPGQTNGLIVREGLVCQKERWKSFVLFKQKVREAGKDRE